MEGEAKHVDGHGGDMEGEAHPEGKSSKKHSGHHTWSYNLDAGQSGITVFSIFMMTIIKMILNRSKSVSKLG